jgi:GNAT superfamily N-acetyltransferase
MKLLLWLLLLGHSALAAAQPNPALLRKEWPAVWIAHPGAPAQEAGVYHFRRSFDLPARPRRFVVHVSADNRYRLFVNGVAVSSGPQRSDVMHWRYETVDLAPHLRAGRNVLAAMVWNWGEHRPVAQMSHRTGFLLQGDTAAEAAINSGPAWKSIWNKAYSFAPVPWPDSGGYYVAAPSETVDARTYAWGWQAVDSDERGWAAAAPLVVRAEAAKGAVARGAHSYGESGEWQLVPRSIPPMEERQVRFAGVRRAAGMRAGNAFLRGTGDLVVPARTRASILVDQAQLTFAYPVLVASGGAGASATMTFAEALFDAEGRKGNRNEIDGKTIRGVKNRILFDGGERRRFEGLWPRAYRYVRLDIETADAPLRLHDFHGIFTAFPFEQRAAFASDQQWIGDVWEIDWRVFRLSAFETFWDTPYYEQLQYLGDTRIESLISLYNAGDDRLMRNAIEQFDQSRIPDGLTASRYPSALPQYIPPFSLWWVAMVHDHWMHRGDAEFARRLIPGVRSVLAWHERHVDAGGMLGPMPWWNFLDWNAAYERGVPPGAENGNSTPLTFQFAYALQQAAEIEEALGQPAEGARYRALAARLIAGARARAWDDARGLFADTPDKKMFGQQTNALAVLVGAAPDAKAVMERVLADKVLIQASFYFRFYVDEAMREAGLGDRYLERLEPWREMVRLGLTTTPETPEPTRSDSHAWSAHPNYHLLASVLGVRPAAPGFKAVTIAPALGPMRRASGRIPHPAGAIEVRLRRTGQSGISAEVTLPEGTPGTFRWNGRSVPLRPGHQRISL